MRHLVVFAAVVALGCKAGDKPKVDPTPVGSGSAGSGSAMAGSGSAQGSNAACVVVVAITAETIHYDGGGLKGNVDRQPHEFPDLGALKPLAGTCSALVTADGDILYQDVIAVMDSLVKIGITDVSIGKPGDKPEPAKPRPAVPPTDLITAEWKKDANGKLVLEGAFKPTPSAKETLKTAPIIIVTKTQVLFETKEVGKPDDYALDTKIAAALPKDPKNPTLILQADAETPASAINQIVSAANQQGYTSLLFAVKGLKN